jgi:uncharacterized protein YjdB
LHRSAPYLVLAIGLAACGGDKTTAPPAPATSTVSIEPEAPSLAVGATVALSATPRDAAGAVVPGRTATWMTLAPDVATVNASTGVVTGVRAGPAVIRATIDQKFDQVTVTVVAPVTSVEITARRTSVGVNGSLLLTATARDANGAVLSGRTITWATADATKANVTQAGLVSGVNAGTVAITATAEGVAGTFNLNVVNAPPPQIAAVSPATLTPGATVTIDGANFDTNPADLDVTIAGVPTTVTAASAGQLTVQIPAFVPCRETGNATVSITGVGGTATHAHPMRVATPRSVAVGQLVLLGASEAHCNELPATPGRYALAVLNASEVPSSTVALEFRGLGPATSASAAPARSGPTLTWDGAGGRVAGLVSPLRRTALALHQRDHLAWLEQERALARTLGSSRRAFAAARQRAASQQALGSAGTPAQRSATPVPLEVGATTTLRIRTADINCSSSRDVPARVVYVGDKAVILESTDAPLAKTMDDDFVALGQAYDATMHNVLVQHFGNPLAYDAKLDNNGKLVMLFTKAVNDRAPNLLGFITACDFFPSSDAATAASNQAEIFYARVPTSTEADFSSTNTRVGWLHTMWATVIHEAKHIVSYAERFETPVLIDEFEESWLEEATAQAAIEFYARATHYAGKATWKGNATYANTMRCDIRTTQPECNGQPSLIDHHFIFLLGYLETIETKSYFNAASADITVYGSGWLLVRWAADHYATDEAAFFRAMTQNWNVTGLRNIESLIGRSYASFQPDFMLSLYADDLSGFAPPAGARYTIPSWNMRDMFLGISKDFTRNGEALPSYPLRVRSSPFGAFTASVGALRGGAAAFVELSGTPAAPQVLELVGPGGTVLSSNSPIRLAILRVE